MENVSKALIMAGAVLLSMMIIGLLVYAGRSFGLIARAEDEAMLKKNKVDFNAEYEVYEKTLMYGTDVLSCLNKAQNNNQKYVNYNYFGKDSNDAETRMEYLINVHVTLKKDIEESVKVYYLNDAGKKIQFTGNVGTGDRPFKDSGGFSIPANCEWFYFKNGQVIQETGAYIATLWENPDQAESKIATKTIKTTLKKGTHKLYSTNNTDDGEIGKLAALISVATLSEQTILNKDYNYTAHDWYTATWRTAAYDFKTRKFKCTSLKYSSVTGYVCEIKFEEI